MDEFLETLGFIIRFLIIGFTIVIGIGFMIVVGVCGIMMVDYQISRVWDNSYGKVYCDNKLVYEGRLYRVHDYVRTNNLQSPMFTITITSPMNRFKTEKCYFCKDFKVTDNK